MWGLGDRFPVWNRLPFKLYFFFLLKGHSNLSGGSVLYLVAGLREHESKVGIEQKSFVPGAKGPRNNEWTKDLEADTAGLDSSASVCHGWSLEDRRTDGGARGSCSVYTS